MKRERQRGVMSPDSFFQRLAKRYGLSEADLSRLKELQLSGVPRAEIFRLASSGRSHAGGIPWLDKNDGKIKDGRFKYS